MDERLGEITTFFPVHAVGPGLPFVGDGGSRGRSAFQSHSRFIRVLGNCSLEDFDDGASWPGGFLASTNGRLDGLGGVCGPVFVGLTQVLLAHFFFVSVSFVNMDDQDVVVIVFCFVFLLLYICVREGGREGKKVYVIE